MRWGLSRVGALAAAAFGVAGCERLGLGPDDASSSAPQPQSVAAAGVDLAPHQGEVYADFLSRSGMDRFGPEALGLSPSEAQRFSAAMPATTPARVLSGGGAEVFLFAGCAVSGCEEGMSVLAIDAATGAAFLGLRDQEGAEVLVPNARVEALLSFTSPSGRWDDPSQARSGSNG